MADYDKYYQTEDLFGDPYDELIDFFSKYPKRGRLLDLGCGQGRNAIALARLGYQVHGVDNSKVGIDQLLQVKKRENLSLEAEVANIFEFEDYLKYDFILLDSMFHFTKKDKKKEIELIDRIIKECKNEAILIFCIQDTGEKVKILKQLVLNDLKLDLLLDKEFKYIFEDKDSDHRSETNYRMIIVRK